MEIKKDHKLNIVCMQCSVLMFTNFSFKTHTMNHIDFYNSSRNRFFSRSLWIVTHKSLLPLRRGRLNPLRIKAKLLVDWNRLFRCFTFSSLSHLNTSTKSSYDVYTVVACLHCARVSGESNALWKELTNANRKCSFRFVSVPVWLTIVKSQESR